MEDKALANELKTYTEYIKTHKDTSHLYKFKNTIDKCLHLNDKRPIINRSTIIECIKGLKNLLPSKLLENLLKKAIDSNDIDLGYTFINNVQILEEPQAVDCLKFFLKDYTKTEPDERLERNLDSVFKRNYDYRLLTTELKRLSSNEFLICLQYLQNYLNTSFQPKLSSTENNDEKSNSDDGIVIEDEIREKPTILQITDLFSCFVDAHFTHITLSTKSQETIVDALQLIETQLDLFMDLISIESLVKEIKQNNDFQVKSNSNLGHYYIEVLKLV